MIGYFIYITFCVIIFSKNITVHSRHIESGSELVLVHVLFRHGNRTPARHELYPNDPYLNTQYFPIGYGELTNVGKQRMFRTGKMLRERYDSFLGDIYYPDYVASYSTDYKRTKSSLLLVLAGLFTPKRQQIWNEDLLWQPIPYNYSPFQNDKVLNGVECPNYLRLYSENEKSQKQLAEFAQYGKTLDYIAKHSGKNVTRFRDVYDMYFGLNTENELGFVLPSWTKPVFPEVIIELAIREYYVKMANTDMKKFAAGFLIKKILEDTKKKINGEDRFKRLYLYSAHENNISQLLLLLGTFTPHIPNYGAHLALEVHRLGNGTYGFKIVYENYVRESPQELKLPGCNIICPLEEFEAFIKEYLPNDNDTCSENSNTS